MRALGASGDDEVLEIGPGRGELTRHLAGGVRRLVLVELDAALAGSLRRRYADDPSVEVINADVLRVRLEEVSEDVAALKVIGNIPYNITTPILFSLLERRPRPRELLLMVQREVAGRILARPGTKQYGALSVGVRSVASAERVLNVSRTAFRPVPEVDSTALRVTPHRPPRLSEQEERALRGLTRAAFSRRRKQLGTTLRDGYGLEPDTLSSLAEELELELSARPETLSPERFVELARALSR